MPQRGAVEDAEARPAVAGVLVTSLSVGAVRVLERLSLEPMSKLYVLSVSVESETDPASFFVALSFVHLQVGVKRTAYGKAGTPRKVLTNHFGTSR